MAQVGRLRRLLPFLACLALLPAQARATPPSFDVDAAVPSPATPSYYIQQGPTAQLRPSMCDTCLEQWSSGAWRARTPAQLLSDAGGVPSTRQVIAGTGLSGGGALSADVTLGLTYSSLTINAPAYMSGWGSVALGGTLSPAWSSQSANLVFAGPTVGSAAPTFRSLVAGDIPALSYVSSVGLSLPGIFTVSGSPVTSTGTLSATLATEGANLVFAGPTSGLAATPTFRSLVLSDISALLFYQTIQAAGIAQTQRANLNFGSEFSLSDSAGSNRTTVDIAAGGVSNAMLANSALTINAPSYMGGWGSVSLGGSLSPSWSSQSANLVFAGPTVGSAAPTFRSLVAGDIPALSYVTSVGLSLPGIFTVSGSPVTSSGTLTGTLANQSANLIFAGPSSGSAAAPTFRALASADLPSGATYCDGSSSAVHYTTDTTLAGPLYPTNLTVDAGVHLYMNGYPICGTGTLTNNGTITDASGKDASGITAGQSYSAHVLGSGATGAGSTTGAGSNGSSANGTNGLGGSGGAGGTGGSGAGGTGGTGRTAGAASHFRSRFTLETGWFIQCCGSAVLAQAFGGGSGASGGGDGNKGGAGGASGGVGLISFPVIVNNGVMSLDGGAGASAAALTGTNLGGGGGGGGGTWFIQSASFSGNPPTANGGAGGAGKGSGTSGSPGSAGTIINVPAAG